MLKQDEITKIIDEQGELPAIEACAVAQVDALLETLNKFAEESSAYKHPAVALATLVELTLIVVTQAMGKEHWDTAIAALIEQLQHGLEQAKREEEETKEEAVDG